VNEFGARLPHFLLCVGTGAVLFALARRERGPAFAWCAAAVFATSALTCYVSGAVLTDPALCCAVTVALAGFWRAVKHGERPWALVSCLGLACGLLVKGPVAAALVAIPVGGWSLQHRALREVRTALPVGRMVALVLLVALPWYLAAEYHAPGFLRYFLIGENWQRFVRPGWSGDLYGGPHREPHGMIWLFGFGATLPWSLVVASRLLGADRSRTAASAWRDFALWWTLAPVLIFTFAGNIVWTYVLPGVPGFALYAAERLHGRCTVPVALRRVVPAVLALALALLPWDWRFDSEKPLVARFEDLRGDYSGPLVYALERPYSAQFYTRGRALQLAASSLAPALARGALAFVALPEREVLAGGVSVPPAYERIADSERFVLYRRSRSAGR
jgi:4-amino-4-deoxy-L-arabinose transferase-like glycosyltransferase